MLQGLSTVQRCRLPRWCAIPGPSAAILCFFYPSWSVMSVSRRNFWNSRVEHGRHHAKSALSVCHIVALGTSVGKLFCAVFVRDRVACTINENRRSDTTKMYKYIYIYTSVYIQMCWTFRLKTLNYYFFLDNSGFIKFIS